MTEYKACTVGHGGHVVSMTPLICADDADAIKQAKQLGGRFTIEVWSGERFVIQLGTTERTGAVTHEIKDGRMVPKK
jgi:hypothetical protein